MKIIQSYRIDSGLVKKIETQSTKTDRTKTDIIEEAIRFYFKILNIPCEEEEKILAKEL